MIHFEIKTPYNQDYWRARSLKYEHVQWVKSPQLLLPMVKALPIPCGSLLDVGAGTGVFANLARHHVGKVYALDTSRTMMAGISGGIIKVQGDAHSIPFQPACLDCIAMRNVLHYLEDKHRAAEEISRSLKTGALFLFSQVIPSTAEISAEYDWLIGREIHYPTQSEILSIFSSLEVVDIQVIVLSAQSIGDWLDKTAQTEADKQRIMERHRTASDHYKRLVNSRESQNDIFVDIKHLFMKMRKP